jgi:glycine cleavage system H protein
VVELNESLRDDPSLANSDPLGAGWFYKIKLSHPEELSALLTEEAYAVLLQNS